ncbi:MAG: hypothetical protein WCI71_04675 [Bacteroidota bacterium]
MAFSFLKKLRVIFLSPFLLALPVTLLIIFLLPGIFNRYRLEIIRNGLIDKRDGIEHYADIDQDGNSERLVLFNNTEGNASIKIIRQNGFILGHFYFSGEIIYNGNSFTTATFDSQPTGQAYS